MSSTTNDIVIHGKNIELYAITNTLNGNRYGNFQLDFNPNLTLTNLLEHPEMRNAKDDEWEMGLIKCGVWNTMLNVFASKGNNTFRFHISGVAHTITLADGNYTYASINDEINFYLSSLGLTVNLITFTPNTATSRLRIIVKPTIKVDFTLAQNLGIATFLGFTGQNIDNTLGVNNLIVVAPDEPQMNVFGSSNVLVETIQVRVNTVNHRVYTNGHNSTTATQNDILYEFGINSTPSTLQVERQMNSHYIKIRPVNTISSIRITFTNQDGVELPLNKEATCQLQLRRSMDYRIQKVAQNNGKTISFS